MTDKTKNPARSESNALLLVIAGPTGSGKTALALALAERLNGEVVSCDSVAAFREFEIGTAKPSRECRARAPHHLLDVVEPGETYTAGEYARQARAALADITQRGKLPIVAGGTGLYLRALIDGLFAGPQRSEELRLRLHAQAQSKGAAYLHRVLKRMDAASSGSIHVNDTPKIIRAIEVCLLAREKMSELFRRGRDPLTGYRIVRIGLEPKRDLLYARINRRCEEMFAAGLVEETRRLLEKYPLLLQSDVPNSPIHSLGYRQAAQLLRGELSRDAAIAAAQQAHRNYAKRQLTWFRRDPHIHWLQGFGDDPALQAEALRILKVDPAG